MSVKSEQAITVLFSTAHASTGAATDADSTPLATLYVNGAASAATVTVTKIATGVYKAAVTLPTVTAGDVVSLRVAATVSGVAGEGVVWQEVADTERVSDLNDPTAASVADAVWDEAVAGHAGVGSTGAALSAAGGSGDPWGTALPGAYGAGTAGALLGALSLAGIAAAVWNRLTTALTVAGSVGSWLLAKLGLISSSTTVTVASPVTGDTVTTYQGDDYDDADGRAIAWDVNTAAILTGGTVKVVIHNVGSFDGEVVDDTTVRLELTAEQSATIAKGSHRYEVILTQPDGDRITLARGVWTSNESYTVPDR